MPYGKSVEQTTHDPENRPMSPNDIYQVGDRWVYRSPDDDTQADVTDYPFWWMCLEEEGHPSYRATLPEKIAGEGCPRCYLDKLVL